MTPSDPESSSRDLSGLSRLHAGEKDYPSEPSASLLESFPNRYPHRDYRIRFHCPEFTSLCPVTGQPDFASIDLEYVAAARCLESKSLKLYLFAFRNQGTFGEDIVNRILEDCVACLAPKWMKVTGRFSARGGISIEVTAEHGHLG